MNWKGRPTKQSSRNLKCCSVLCVKKLRKSTKLHIKLVTIPARIRIRILWKRGRQRYRWSLSVWFHCTVLHNCCSVLYQLQLYLESTEIMDNCFGKLQSTERESLVVYVTSFIKSLPHANNKVTLNPSESLLGL